MTSGAGQKRAAIDRSVHGAVVRLKPSRADAILATVSRLANHGVLWFGAAGVLAISGPTSQRAAARGLVSLGIASATANLVGKTLVGGPRPEAASIPFARRLRKFPTSGSFPSGHSASAAAFAAGVALEQPLAGAIVAPLAGAVAYSRIHVGAHWFSDVVGGVTIGIAAAAVTVAVSRPAWLRRPTSEPPAVVVELPALPDGGQSS
jgi:membrane-associated phospholipid phosphatase